MTTTTLAHPAVLAPHASNAHHSVRPEKLTRPAAIAQAAIQPKPAKKRNRIPPSQRFRVMQKYALGTNQTAIAREEGINRETVGRIVKCPEMDAYVEEKRELWRGLCDPAIEVIRQKLKEGDKEVALRVLESNGVIPAPGVTFSHNITTTANPNQDDRVKKLRACFADVMMERAKVFRTPMPELAEIAEQHNIEVGFDLRGASDEAEQEDES
jgi:hypothetical protein